MVLDNDLILSGLSDKIILSCQPSFISKIYKTMDGIDVVIFDKNSSGSMEYNKNFTDNDMNIIYKYDINHYKKIQPF
jgi:hypothetical protein